ncbi:MAG: hypothetical protein IPL63_11260 [Saprospiraceae bacterium]|nr:hypothetical protein [Saprospiraceae bacterium]
MKILKNGLFCRDNIHIKLNDYNGALSDYNIALKLNPDDNETYVSRADTKVQLEDTKGAMLNMEGAMEIMYLEKGVLNTC